MIGFCVKIGRILAAAGVLSVLLGAMAAQAAELARAQSLTDAITEDAQRRPIPDRPGGPRVLRAVITGQDAHSLRLLLELEFFDGYEIRVEAVDPAGVPLSAVPTGVVAVDRPQARVSIELAVPPGPEMAASSTYLRVAGRRQERSEDFLRLYFAHEKAWKAPPPVVRPEPIGKAVELLRRLEARNEDLGEGAEDEAAEAATDAHLPSDRVVEEALPWAPSASPNLIEYTRRLHESLQPQLGAIIAERVQELRPGTVVGELIRIQPAETVETHDEPGSAVALTPPQAAIRPLTAPMGIDTSALQILSEPVLERAETGIVEAPPVTSGAQSATGDGRFVRIDQYRLQDGLTANMLRAEDLLGRNRDVLSELPRRDFDLREVPDHVFPVPRPQNEDAPESREPANLVEMSGPALFSMVRSEPQVDVDLHRVLGIESAILPDRNAASGIYYYIPSRYRLAFDRDLGGSRGLVLRIDYDRVTASGADENAVRVAMTLEAPLDANGLAIVSKLMQAYAGSRPDVRFAELRPLPLAAAPQFEFAANLAGMVDAEDIAVTAFSDFLEGLVVTWRTDPVRAERIRRDLASELAGITGTARFPLPSESRQLVREIPAQVRLSDPEVFQAVRFDRSGALENVSPLPVRLKYLHALVLSAPGGPRIYSWSLDDATLPAGKEATLDLANFPRALDSMADRIWIDYGLDPACDGCLGPVVQEALNGGIWPATETVEIDALPSLFEDEDEIVEVEVLMRSRFFEPADRTLREAPAFYLTPEATDHAIGPLFPEASAEVPLYEYRLSVRYGSGRFLEGQNWIAQHRTRLRPGRFQRMQSLGSAPSEE